MRFVSQSRTGHAPPEPSHPVAAIPVACTTAWPPGPAGSGYKHLARLIRLGAKREMFPAPDPALAPAAVVGMVTFPLVLFHSGRIADPGVRDRLVAEMLDAAMGYLSAERGQPG